MCELSGMSRLGRLRRRKSARPEFLSFTEAPDSTTTPGSRPDAWLPRKATAVALACASMYGEGVAGRPAASHGTHRQRLVRAARQARPARLQPATAAGAALVHPMVDGRVAAVGYCFGGGMTVASRLARVAPSSPWERWRRARHAEDGAALPGRSGSKAKILVCHGALDPHVLMAPGERFPHRGDDRCGYRLAAHRLRRRVAWVYSRRPVHRFTGVAYARRWRMRGRALLFRKFLTGAIFT